MLRFRDDALQLHAAGELLDAGVRAKPESAYDYAVLFSDLRELAKASPAAPEG